MKRCYPYLIVVCMLLLFCTIHVQAADISYTYVDSQMLTKGVTLDTYDLFLSDRSWNQAWVVRADLNSPNVSLAVLSDPRGVNYLNTVSSIATSYDTVAAINSDFFNWDERAGRGSPIGTAFLYGSMRSSPARQGGMYTLMQTLDNSLLIDMIDYHITITAPDGATKEIAGLNKSSDLSEIMMFDKNWDSQSLGSTDTRHEMVVRNGIVEEIRFNSAPVALEDNMYVLAALSDWDSFLIDHFKPGDAVTLNVQTNYDFANLSMAAGGGAKLVTNGTALTSFSHNIAGTNPRTAVGIDASGKTAYLAVVDGRRSDSKGMTMTELAAFMQQIGAYNAMNLDGGGSSTMVTRNPLSRQQLLQNVPSDGSQRSIAEVLAVLSNQQETSRVAHFDIQPDDEEVWAGSRVSLSVTAQNEFYSPVDIDQSQIYWEITGVEGSVEGNVFYPKTAGIATLTAIYEDARTSIQLRVLDKPYSIEREIKEVFLEVGQAKDVWMFARDTDGYLGHIPLCDTTVSLSDDIVAIEGTALRGLRTGSALMQVSLGNATVYFAVYVGDGGAVVSIPDDVYGTDAENMTGIPRDASRAMSFGVFGAVRESDTLFNNLIMQRSMRTLSETTDMAFFLSTHASSNIAPSMTIPSHVCYPYRGFVENGNTFLILDTEDDFMSANEWNWLIDQMNHLQTKNVFLFMQTNLGFTSSKETQLFYDLLSGATEYGYKVYVFYNNWATRLTPIGGVKYISTPGFSDDINASSFPSLSFKLRYVLVDIAQDGSVSYRFMQLY